MSEKIYLHLLILCSILCQGIIATSDEDSNESSDVLVRKRRVISHLPGGLQPTWITNANYVVNIRENNRSICVGVILSIRTVITAAPCLPNHVSAYKLSAGSGNYQRNTFHNVTAKVVNYGNNPHQHFDGIALISVDPSFVYSSRISNIPLYAGPLPEGTLGTVFGWGCIYPVRPGPAGIQRKLRSIHVPIMNHEECQNVYRENLHRHLRVHDGTFITAKHICTYDNHQYCARTDAGAPLVVNNRLAGIHVWKGEFEGERNPDVFIDLQSDNYSVWIRENIR